MFGIRKLKREVHLLQYTTDNLINIVAGLQNCFILKGSVNIVRRGGKDCVFLEYKLKRSAIEEIGKDEIVSLNFEYEVAPDSCDCAKGSRLKTKAKKK